MKRMLCKVALGAFTAFLVCAAFDVGANFAPYAFAAPNDNLDAISDKEEGPKSEALWEKRITKYFSADTAVGYKTLEHFCDDFTRNKSRQIDGRWLIDLYHVSFQSYFTVEADKWNSWDSDYKKIKKWQSTYPELACAKIVESTYWSAYAYFGSKKRIQSPDSEESVLFRERLNKAYDILVENTALAAINPAWYRTKLLLDIDNGNSPKEMISLVSRALKQHPNYFSSAFILAQRLLPVRGGSWKDIHAFVGVAVDATRATQKELLYARLYWYVSEIGGASSTLFQDTPADWPSMKRGFDDLMSLTPQSSWNLNNYAAFACRAGDGQTYRSLKPRLSKAVFYPEAWIFGVSIEKCDKYLGTETAL